MTPRFVEDVSALPTNGFGTRSIVWWGTLGFIAIEAMGFLLAVAAYFYLAVAGGESRWPPTQPPPALWASTLFTVILLASLWPNIWTKRQGETENRRGSRIGLVVMSLFGLVLTGVRVLEWGTLNCRWDDSAYGSITWTLLGLHTLHVVTDLGDTLVLAALMLTRHAHGRRFSDVAENAVYWNFVVLAWLPLYVVIYLVPRRIQEDAMATLRQRREVDRAWAGIAAGPFAWFLDQQAAYALAPWACAGHRWAIPLVGALCALLALAGAAVSLAGARHGWQQRPALRRRLGNRLGIAVPGRRHRPDAGRLRVHGMRAMKALLPALVLLPSPALAHGGGEAGWLSEPWVLLPLLLSAELYAVGLLRLWGTVGAGRGIRPWQTLSYVAGWLTLAGALLSPLHVAGRGSIAAHMVEHELLMVVAAPLLVVARPVGAFLWAFPRRLRAPVVGGFRSRPVRAAWRTLDFPFRTEGAPCLTPPARRLSLG